jgi:hypothetical protein
MRPIHWTAIAFASILSSAALGPTLSAQYEKGKPSPQPSPSPAITGSMAANDHSPLGPEQKPSVSIR